MDNDNQRREIPENGTRIPARPGQAVQRTIPPAGQNTPGAAPVPRRRSPSYEENAPHAPASASPAPGSIGRPIPSGGAERGAGTPRGRSIPRRPEYDRTTPDGKEYGEPAPAEREPTRTVSVPDSSETRTSSTVTAREKARKKKNSERSEHIHEESNNAVMSIVKAAIYLVAVLIVSILISMAVILIGNDMYAFVKEDRAVTVVIPEGTTVKELSQILGDAGLVKYPSVFKLYADHKTKKNENFATLEFVPEDYVFPKGENGKEKTGFIAGTYELNSSMDYEDLLWSFLPAPKTGTSWVTIPEGFTTDEIIDLLVSKNIGERDKYVEVINTYDFSDFWFVEELEESGAWNAEEYARDGKVSSGRIYRLDGYLFPDTYEFYNASKEETVIKKMLYRFSQIYNKEYREMTEAQGFSVDELITLASMIEKEAGQANDFFNVSEVFRNRLAAPDYFPYLQSDATVLYEIHHETGKRPKHVTHEDTELQVPYNTYTNTGLPPGPISNPSATAMLAALNPSRDGYYYFVSGPKKTYFATNEWQHNYNVAQAAAEWEEAEKGN